MTNIFSYKFASLFILILHHRLDLTFIDRQKWIKYCKDDLNLCKDCFNEASCDTAFNLIEFNDGNFVNTFNSLFGDRDIAFGTTTVLDKSVKIVIKRLADKESINELLIQLDEDNLSDSENVETSLLENFMDDSRVGGSYICNPDHTIEKFYQILANQFKNQKLFYLLLNLNVQPLILTAFHHKDLPIPNQLNSIGLTSLIEHKGQSLDTFFHSNFMTRLSIAKLLVESILKFTVTDLMQGFHMYLTDLTLDNIVYDSSMKNLTFIDLDNIILVDSRNFKSKHVHVHEKIECNGCFAYSIQDICGAPLSDINIFSTCQLLYEDLHEDQSKGFLHSIPNNIKKNYPELMLELKNCVNCRGHNCDRFKSAFNLIKIFDYILNVKSKS